MDQFYELFNFYAEQFAKIPMFPVLQCVHYTIMNLKLRMGAGKLKLNSVCIIYTCNCRIVIEKEVKTFTFM